MSQFIENSGGLIAAVVLVMVSVNVILMGVSDALSKIAEKTESKVDDKIAAKVASAAQFLKKIVDIIAANRPTK